VGAWDFKASNLTGTLDSSASDITVVNADKTDTDNASNITVATVTPIVDSSAFLIGTLYTGDSTTALGDRLTAGSNSVILSSTGTLTLPNGGVISEIGGAFGGAIRLEPWGASSSTQALVIYPTAGVDGNHIHLTAGGGGTDLYLGNDDQFVKVDHSGTVVVGTYSTATTSTWTFGTDGNLTLPNGMTIDSYGTSGVNAFVSIGGDDTRIDIDNNGAPPGLAITTNGTGGMAQRVWRFGPDGELEFPQGSTISETIATTGTHGTTIIQAGIQKDLLLKTEDYVNSTIRTWTFGIDGVLTLSTASTILGSGTDPNVYIETATTSTTSTWTFGTDGVLTLPEGGTIKGGGTGTDVTIVASTGTNPANWTFGADGNTLFPNAAIDGGTAPIELKSRSWSQLTYNNADMTPATNTNHSTTFYVEGGAAQLEIFRWDGDSVLQHRQWSFSNNGTLTLPDTGTITFPDATVQTTAYVAASVVNKTSGSWTLSTGSNTVSITVPPNGNYTMWVNGNIPNGIVTWNATVNVSNTNVPAIGSQYAWYYALGNALVLTAIPNQIIGTVGVISTSNSYVGNTANVFTFGITNNSTSTQVINWGYTTL
jgi:hypothetical protein